MRSVAVVVALVACVHAAGWALIRGQASAPGFEGQLASVSYAPFDGTVPSTLDVRAQQEKIRADLKVLAPYTRSLRIYSSTGGAEQVPAVAQEFGLKVNVGAWIGKDDARNEREIRAALDLARRHGNVNGITVGNEVLYRNDLGSGNDEAGRNAGVEKLIEMIKRVKRQTSLPVTTGEIWDEWTKYPELASSVDYIAAHILPYWEGFSEKQAVDQAFLIYDNKLRQAFPGKRIVIAEFGWPSAGYNRKDANPGRLNQAEVLRTFVRKATDYGIDYNIIEAVDAPWKWFEGGVGPYWGFLDASLHPKFSWTGAIFSSDHVKLAGIAVLLGVLLSVPVLTLAGVTTAQAGLLAGAAHVVGAWAANVFGFWTGHYFVFGAAVALALGVVLMVPLVLIALARIQEIAAVAFGRKPQRLIASPPLAAAGYAPKVSIHIPAYREPPEMLKQTLDALARLDYANFEAVVVINNTPDPAHWQPVEEHCRVLGERFKFVNAQKLEGFKAGALRLALEHTAPDAEIIGIIDADYAVEPDWLKDLVPHFADPQVGLIQAPQDHRDGARSVMHTVMNCEYAGFFDIGMVQRNEDNAIIVHGTMCLIRRAAMEAAGGWSSDTICEDTDLGLSILELGWTAHYTNRRYGHGLLPDTYEAFKKQRNRWAYGGLQIVKKHWRRLLPGASLLSREQKREFALGWLNWLGAEALGVVVAILNILWVPVVAFAGIAVPDTVLTLPILAAFVVSVLHFAALYRLRVRITPLQMLGAVFAAMSVQWTVARAVGQGLVKDHLPFVRTEKGGKARKSVDFQAFWEALLAVLLLAGAVVLVTTNQQSVREINIFAAVLVVQSLPFLSAVLMASLERSRVNDFAFWRSVEGRLVELLPRRSTAAASPAVAASQAIVEAPAPVAVEHRMAEPGTT